MIRQNFNDSWNFHKEGNDKFIPVTLPHDAMIHDVRLAESPGKDANAYFVGGRYIYEKTFPTLPEWKNKHMEIAFGGVYRNTRVYLNEKELCFRPYGYIPFQAVLDGNLKEGENRIRVEADNSKLPNSRWYSGGGIYRDVELLIGGEAYIPWGGVTIKTKAITPHPLVEIRVEMAGAAEKIAGIDIEILNSEGYTEARSCINITDTANTADTANTTDTADTTNATDPLFHASPQRPAHTSPERATHGSPDRMAHGSPMESAYVSSELELKTAKLYSENSPYLYTCRVTLRGSDQAVLDTWEGYFGIRLITYDKTGLYINGKRTILKGACIHHDNGVIGAVSIYEAEYRRISILKKSGYNAIRMSHHPASEALLLACDRLGMYVMDEYADMWFKSKNPYDYSLDFREWHERDITNMVKQDINHPSVLMYSIGNELSEPASEEGLKVADEIIGLFHRLDDSRIVTGGINSVILMMSKGGRGIYEEGGIAAARPEDSKKDTEKTNEKASEKISGSLLFNRLVCRMGKLFNGLSATDQAAAASEPIREKLDIAGYNYGAGRYLKDARLHPDRVMVGTETYNYEVYDTWQKIARCPAIIGDFMWTGWDYIGEAAIGTWNYEGISVINACYPWLLAGAGAIDITGYPDAQSYYANITWADAEGQKAEPYIGVRPPNHPGEKQVRSTWRGTDAIDSWSWHGADGNPVTVEVYGQGASVNLYINDRLIGRQKLKKLKCLFKTRYEEGCLRAEILDKAGQVIAGKELRSACLSSSAPPKAVIRREACPTEQIEFYSISLEDAGGVVESNMDRQIDFFRDSFEYEGKTIRGADLIRGKELLGFGSANPRSAERFDSGLYTTCYGRAFAVVRKSIKREKSTKGEQQ